MTNRFKLMWGNSGRLKVDWINFLGAFVYYTNSIDIHHHVFYNEKHEYCYTIKTDGKTVQFFSINIKSRKVGMPETIDKCIVCNEKR